MRDWMNHYAVPLFMLLMAAALLIFAHHTEDADLKSFAIGVGGGGLTQLTSAIKASQAPVNKISGGPVTIDQTPPGSPQKTDA